MILHGDSHSWKIKSSICHGCFWWQKNQDMSYSWWCLCQVARFENPKERCCLKILWKEEKYDNNRIKNIIYNIWITFWFVVCKIALDLDKSTILMFGTELILHWTILKKTLWEKEKMLVTSILLFPQSFLPYQRQNIWMTCMTCTLLFTLLSFGKKFPNCLWFSWPYRRRLLKTLEKGENAGNQHFLLFQQCFLLFWDKINSYKQH